MKWTDKDINGKEFKPLEGQTKPYAFGEVRVEASYWIN